MALDQIQPGPIMTTGSRQRHPVYLPEDYENRGGSMIDRKLQFNKDPLNYQVPFAGPSGQGGGGFGLGSIGRGLGDLWGGMKKYAGGMGGSDWLDAIGTIYGIYNNESFKKPMLERQQRRAEDLWNTQKPMMQYNLASGLRNEGRADAYQVGLWNAQRPQGTEERSIEQGMPRTTYV